jgi:hypothetical protein
MRESSSGSHRGHANAETAGDRDSSATAKWPADREAFMVVNVLENSGYDQGTTPRTRVPIFQFPPTATRSDPRKKTCSTPDNLVCGDQMVGGRSDGGRVTTVWDSPYYWPPTKNQARAKCVEKNKTMGTPDEPEGIRYSQNGGRGLAVEEADEASVVRAKKRVCGC